MKAWEATVRKTQAVAKKRANTIFGTYASAPHVEEEEEEENVDDYEYEEHPSGEMYQAEKFLPNGDYYTGYWADSFPHGTGKYWWTDGCMYVGEWFRGKTMGKGTFSWPSGAMYEGNFKSGFMDGEGTYTTSNGGVYRGMWMMNFKHGRGAKDYANGDCYEGEWCRGMQEGHGRYQWKSGNYYVGDWKNGNICGKGTLHWTNGKVYDGNWEDGHPKGYGKLQWPDGSLYVGNWSKDPKDQNGTYYPAGSTLLDGNLQWDPQEVFNVDLQDCKVCVSEKVSILPSNKKLAMWRSTKANDSGSRPRRMSVDGRLDASIDRDFARVPAPDFNRHSTASASDRNGIDDGLGSLQLEDVSMRGSPIRIPKVVKQQGETISKGHKNYDLMLNLQLGIRYGIHIDLGYLLNFLSFF